MTESLQLIFSEFGNVIDIVAKKNLKAKGQAFVVFDSHESAQYAIDELQGFQLFDKPLRLALAKTRSDKIMEKTCSADDYDEWKKYRLIEKGMIMSEVIELRQLTFRY